MIHFSMKRYLNNVCLNVVKVAFCSLVLPLLFYTYLEPGLACFVLVVLSSVLMGSFSAYMIGCTRNEKLFIREKLVLTFQRVVG